MDTVREGDTLRRRARSRSTDDVTKGNSEGGGGGSDAQPPPEESPTTQLLQEYEMHLRNTLAKGMDAESYSLHTFEQLLTQSMENLDKILSNDRDRFSNLQQSPRRNSRSSPHIPQFVMQSATLPSMAHGSHRGWRANSLGTRGDTLLNGRMPTVILTRPMNSRTVGNALSSSMVDSKELSEIDSKKLSQTLPAVPTRRNVKPHLPFEKKWNTGFERHTINVAGSSKPLHQPLLHALPTNIPLDERKLLREKLLSEIASKHDVYKAKHGGGCIVLDATSQVNGESFLSLWRSTEANKVPESSRIAHCHSTFMFDDGNSTEKYQQLVQGDKEDKNTNSALSQFRRWKLGEDSQNGKGIMAAGAGGGKGAGPGGGGVSRGSERSLVGAGLRDERPAEHSGYFSDRNESFGSRRELYDRGYTSDHDRRFYDRQDSIRSGYASDHERGYASDRDSRGYMSDRERGGYMSDRERTAGVSDTRDRGYMSDRERGYMSDRERGGYMSNRERGYYSDRERGYMSDRERGYVSDRERGYVSDRDSRGYASDRERGYYSDREHTALMAQASMESADSRLCYLTSSEISDDDRMSLTTAVSEDEDGESADASPYKGARGGTTAASFNCTGAVRKAGFLSVKKWLLRKKHQIELARKRGWKGYWVCLKGTTLLFYPCDSREGRSVEAAPKHLIIVDGAIMQPVPEHPKRDYIFCLSTAFGDAYLFQAPCQVELENWVNSIHSACAAAFARHRGKTGTLHLLQEEIFRIDRAIESDSKLKHMAELQLSVVSDSESKTQILGQIQQWEENLERLHCEQFRLRCYMASLQSGELPNPKGLLMFVSRSTKGTLSRLGVFTVSSFHAYICARSPSLLNNLLAGRGATKRRAPMLSRSNSVSSRRSLQLQQNHEPDKVYKVSLPDNQMASITLREAMSVEEFLVAASSGRGLNPLEHFVRVKKRRELEETNYFVPHRTDLIENYLATHEVVEICAKILYQVELSRSSLDHMWGFSVEAELIENSERQDELCCYISRVEDRSTAMQNGIIKSDEIMVINGAIVSDLDMMYIESVLQEELALCLMMRSSRTEPPDLASLMKTTDEIIESLVCPPPPSESSLNEEMISSMIVPAPSWSKQAMTGHMQPPMGGIGGGPMGIGIPGMGMNNMGSVSALNSMGGIGYNNMGGYGIGGVMMGAHQQQVPHGMLQYGKEPASPDGFPPPASDSSDRSNVSSLEIESFLKAGGGNTSDLSGCSRSPVETRRPSHGGSVVGVGGVAILPGCGPPSGSLERERGLIDRDRMDRERDRLERDRGMDRERNNMDRRGSGGGGSVTGGSVVGVDRASPTGSLASSHSQSQLTPSRQLSHAERLRKVLSELVETEASYVKHLNNLLENYLEPLRNASFLTSAEVTALFGNIREIVAFQRLFLQALREAIDIEPDFNKFDQPYEFKTVLVSIASAFLYYASQFKLYSSFCASHSKAQKVLHPSEGNQALQEFLASRNPRQQHSATLESYLIKPIQRILKYPLLLQQLKNLTEPGTEENRHLVEALMVMEKVAEHINEMQRIHEEYGAIFDHLFRQHQKASKQPVDLSPGDLLYYGGVEWLNISDFLGKIKKGLELHAMCFVFKTAVVFLCKERLRQKKKLMGGVSGKNSSAEVEIIRYQVLIPVTEVQVRASSMKDVDSHFLWELLHLKNQLQRRTEKVYHLSNSTSEFRNAFLKTIRQIIRESVRNMSIPNKPPGGGKEGGGGGASGGGGGRGGSVGGGGSGGGSARGGLNTNTLQSTRSGGPRKKQPAQNQSATLQRHSAGGMDYCGSSGNMESYDNVPETHHNGHVPQQHHEMNGAAAFRNRGKMGSDATADVSTPKLQYRTVKVYHGLPSTDQRGYISPNQPVRDHQVQSSWNSTKIGNSCSATNLPSGQVQPTTIVHQIARNKVTHHMPTTVKQADYLGQISDTKGPHQLLSAPKAPRVYLDGSNHESARQMASNVMPLTPKLPHQLSCLSHTHHLNLDGNNRGNVREMPTDMKLSTNQLPHSSNRPHSETPLTVRQWYTPTIDVRNSYVPTNPVNSAHQHVRESRSQLSATPNLRYKKSNEHGSNSNSLSPKVAGSAVRLTVQSKMFPSLNTTINEGGRNISHPMNYCSLASVPPSQLPRSSQLSTGTLSQSKTFPTNSLTQLHHFDPNNVISTPRYPARTAYVRSNSDSDVCFGNYDPNSQAWNNETNDKKSSSQNKLGSGRQVKDLPAKQTTGRASHPVRNQQLSFSYTKRKTSGNSSDTEVNCHIRPPQRKLDSYFVKNLEIADDTYDYPDLMKTAPSCTPSYNKYASSPQPSQIPLRSENRHHPPVVRRDVKSSIVVNGDVPSLLKSFEKQDPSVLTTCDVRRIREVEKIVKGWQAERIIQSNEDNPTAPLRNIRTTNERTVDRSKSRHKELKALGTLSDILSTLPSKSHQATSTTPNLPGISTKRGSLGSSRPLTSLSSMRSPNQSLSSSSLSSATSSGAPTQSSRSSFRLSTGASSPAVSQTQRSRHAESESSPASSQVRTSPQSAHPGSVPRSNSMEGITIESLMEQLKALS